jgi:hypothetical protein
MDLRTTRLSSKHALSLTSIASKLAPTRFLNGTAFIRRNKMAYDHRWNGSSRLKDATFMEIPFSQISERLNNRRFTVADNAQGLSGAGTVFHYQVEGDAVSGTYQGGRIRIGHQVGRVTGADTIELLFQCLTTDGEILAGWSRGTVGVDRAGRTTLTFVWGWLSGATGGGDSSYVELVA